MTRMAGVRNGLLKNPYYDPNKLLDEVMKRIGARSDAHLARMTKIAAPVISHVRHKRLVIGDSILLKLHDATGLPARELRALMGIVLPLPLHLECKHIVVEQNSAANCAD